MKDYEIEIINGVEYKLITIRNRSKLVSREGDLINPFKRNQKAITHINKDGYVCCGGGVPIHLYVAYAWVDGWFEGAEVNHKDFNRQNYNYNNLEWVSHKDNIKWSSENSKHYQDGNSGENNGRATFTKKDVLKIRELYDNGMSIANILKLQHPELQTSKQYHSLHSTYRNICKRITWKNI